MPKTHSWTLRRGWRLKNRSKASIPKLNSLAASDRLKYRQAIEFSDRRGLPLGKILSRDREHTAAVTLDRVSPQFIQANFSPIDNYFSFQNRLDR